MEADGPTPEENLARMEAEIAVPGVGQPVIWIGHEDRGPGTVRRVGDLRTTAVWPVPGSMIPKIEYIPNEALRKTTPEEAKTWLDQQ